MIDGIIFDLDGTLWNSTGATYMIWNDAFRAKGIDFSMTYEKALHYMGMTMFTIKAELIDDGIDPKIADDIVSVMSSSSSDYKFTDENGDPKGVVLYEGCLEVLNKLSKRHKLFIVSNCGSGYIESFLETFHIASLFTDFECYGGTGLHKADNIKLVIERNFLHNPIYVGDTAGDEAATRSAGIPFVFARYGLGKAVCPDHEIYRLSDLCYLAEML
ncbi:MAG: HAD family hydrolase [Clostridia bacterium]|nr:HAD family hydrolase [Clostridia bacterium]